MIGKPIRVGSKPLRDENGIELFAGTRTEAIDRAQKAMSEKKKKLGYVPMVWGTKFFWHIGFVKSPRKTVGDSHGDNH